MRGYCSAFDYNATIVEDYSLMGKRHKGEDMIPLQWI